MVFCNFCAKTSEQFKNICENKVIVCGNVVKIKDLLKIFQSTVTKFLIDDKDSVICNNCFKQLKRCYEFVQQIRESANKLNRDKEINTKHDYFEKTRNETDNTKVTVNNVGFVEQVNLEASILHHNFKPILPKTSDQISTNEKIKKATNIKSRLYKCLLCTEFFKSYKHLSEHEKDFCKNKLVKSIKVCKFCHKSYSKQDMLSDHVALKHTEGEYMCCFCEDKKVFSAKGYLCRHIEKAHQHESLQFFCGECTDTVCFPSQDELRVHFSQNHPAEITKTTVEDQTDTNLNDEEMDLEMHEEFLDEFLFAHTNENSFQFSECWEALDLHLPDMLQESAANMNNMQEFTQAFSCPKCYEQFKNPQPLLKHLADLHDLPVLVCRVCGKCLASLKDFKRHKLHQCPTNSTVDSITLDCPYCSKKFQNALNLKQHLRIVHCQLKKHVCQLCDKLFTTLDHLKKHVLSLHQNERKHICTVCDKKFTQMGHLKQHLAIHTTGKAVQCVECSSKFWRKIDLEKHRKKNHTCSIQLDP